MSSSVTTYILPVFLIFGLVSSTLFATPKSTCIAFYETPKSAVGRFIEVANTRWPFDPLLAARSTWKVIMDLPSANKQSITVGTLFFVSDKGHFLTNWHLMSPYIQPLAKRGMFDIQKGYQGQKGAITLRPGGRFYLKNTLTGQIVALDSLSLLFIPGQNKISGDLVPPENDFVMGQIENIKTDSVKLSRSSCCLMDSSVFSIGYPEKDIRLQSIDLGANGNLKASQGKIENTFLVGLLKRPVLRTSLPLAGGASGSPVFSSSGDVIGIYTGGGETIANPGVIRTAVVTSESIIKKLNQFESSQYLANIISNRQPE